MLKQIDLLFIPTETFLDASHADDHELLFGFGYWIHG